MKIVSNKILLGILPIIIVLAGCDEIVQPIKSSQVNSVLPTSPPTFSDSSAVSGSTSYKNYKLLLEDLTGHFCNNCPLAAAIGDSLINPAPHFDPTFAGNIILMEENVGNFSEIPPQYPDPPGIKPYAWATNYQSVAGNTWVTLYNPVGFPMGVINRMGYPSSFGIGDNNWTSTISGLLTPVPTAQVTINIHDSCWIPERIMGATFQVNIGAVALSGSYLLQTLIIEDSVISGQMDQYVDSGYVTAFAHRNVLRGAIGNNTGGLVWGTAIPTSITGTAGQSWTLFQTYDFTQGENGTAATWNMAHCYIVAFVYNATTNTTPYQVLQAEMIKVE